MTSQRSPDFTVEYKPNAQSNDATQGWADRNSILYLVVHQEGTDHWRVVTLERTSEMGWKSAECIEV